MEKKVAEALVDASNDKLTLHEQYSGRFMYGTSTYAVSGEPNDFTIACSKVSSRADEYEIDPEELYETLERLRHDNLGLDMIYY